MMNFTHRDVDELKTKIHTFRVSDLQSLVACFGRSRNGKKQDLQNRALEILRTQPSDVDILAFKRKVHELYRVAQDEAKQTHYDYQTQQRIINQNQQGNAYMNQQGQYGLPPQTRPAGSSTIIYQNGSIVSGTGYPNPNAPPLYSTQVHYPTLQPPAAVHPNLTTAVRILGPPISPINIKFKSLPFYRIRHEIMSPTILKIKSNGRNNAAAQIFQTSFLLTCEIASDITMNRDYLKNDYTVQAQLRMCAIDNTNNQIIESNDLLPLGLQVRMNDRPCSLPPCSPGARPNVESRRLPLPINLTPYLKLSPMNANKLTINWLPETGRTFVACINVVEKLTSSYLLDRLKKKPAMSVDIMKEMIARQFKRVVDDDNDNGDADDDDIATTIVRVSLQCPLAKFRIMHPARGKNCGHLQCFDGLAYISCNEKKSVWMCPVCSRYLHYDDLLIDQYFVDVLASEDSADCQEVQLFVDGSWKVYEEEKVVDMKDKSKANPDSPDANICSVDSEDLTGEEKDQKHVVSDNAVSTTSVINAPVLESFVDLTEDDDEADTETGVSTPAINERSELQAISSDDEDRLEIDLSPKASNDEPDRVDSPAPVANQPSPTLTTPRVSPASSPPHNSSEPTSPVSPAISLRISSSSSETQENETDTCSNEAERSQDAMMPFRKPVDLCLDDMSKSPVLFPSADENDEDTTDANDRQDANADVVMVEELPENRRGSVVKNANEKNSKSYVPLSDSDEEMPLEEETMVRFERASVASAADEERCSESSIPSRDTVSSETNEMANLNIGN